MFVCLLLLFVSLLVIFSLFYLFYFVGFFLSLNIFLVCDFVLFVYVNINRSTNCIPVVSSYPVVGR